MAIKQIKHNVGDWALVRTLNKSWFSGRPYYTYHFKEYNGKNWFTVGATMTEVFKTQEDAMAFMESYKNTQKRKKERTKTLSVHSI